LLSAEGKFIFHFLSPISEAFSSADYSKARPFC
jgi:hypothetical protein